MREMAGPSETYSDAFLSRRSGNPNTTYRAIKSETWRWHFRGVVYIFRKPRLFARGTASPAINGCCGIQHRTGALGQGENSVVGGRSLLATSARGGSPGRRQQIKKREEMILPLTILSVSGVFDYGFFTGFFGARLVAAGFLA